jgi:hypothetical protein
MPQDKQFLVCTMEGKLHTAHMTEAQAEAVAKDANECAVQMGLRVRYEVKAA